jgi:serine/threonine protein kinase/tetratricopeptide (TPR) repeat protein
MPKEKILQKSEELKRTNFHEFGASSSPPSTLPLDFAWGGEPVEPLRDGEFVEPLNGVLRQNESLRFSNRYKIIKDLGEGGIGRVYKAYDLWSKKEIALKILTLKKEKGHVLENFKSEFLLLTQLRHPGVVEVFDFGYAKRPGDLVHFDHLHGEVPYFTMEFVEGKTLYQSFDLSSSKDSIWLESEKLYHFIWQICDILEYLHLRGIVHCDLKPDNLKVTNRIFNLKLLDFGLSEQIGTRRKKTAKGTLPYMAPEMFLDASLDERTDLYSLGVILYELVTSKLPFFSDDPMKIVSGHLEQMPAPPKDSNPRVAESLNQLILKLLEKSPSQRLQSASEVKKFAERHLIKNSEIAERKTFLSHLYSGELVAREKEEAQVGQLLKEAVSLGGRVALLAGEQGAGKSFFLRDLRIRSQLEGILYVDSDCLENQTKAYQPLIEILHKMKPYWENCDPSFKEKFSQSLKLIFEKPQDQITPFHEQQSLIHQKIIESLTQFSQIFPMVLVVDNLQWADFQTMRFLSDLGKNIEKSKIFLACAFRPEETREETPLKELVDGWTEARWCKYIKLDRFDSQKTLMFIRSKLKRERFPEDFFLYMHQITSGNPFFLTEVLKYLLERQIVFLKDCIWEVDSEKLEQTSLPDSIEAVLLKNLDRYDQKILDFLNVVSVIGKKFDSQLIEKLNLFTERDLSKILFILGKDQVFIEKEGPVRGRLYYEFANQSLQSLLYQRFDNEKKIKLHRRIAELLEESGLDDDEETVFEIGHHYLKSGQSEKAYQYSLLSAEKMAQRFANQEVLEYLGVAIETTSKFNDKEDGGRKKLEALMRRADFHKQIGELNQALKDYKTILRLSKNSSNLKMIAEAYNDLGDTYRLKHDYTKGLASLKKALEIRQKLNDPLEVAHTLNNMGLLYWIDSQYQEALISDEKALSIYTKLEDKFHAASTLNNIGLIYWTQSQYEKAMKFFENSLKIKKELGDKAEMARSLNNIGATYFYLGKYDEAVKCYLESFELNEQIKDKKEIALNLENLGDVYQKMGDFENALKYNERGLALAQDIALPKRVGYILENMGEIQFHLGNYKKAYEYFNRAIKTAKDIEDKELQILVSVNLSKFFTVLNDDQRAEQLLEEATKIINLINDDRSLIKVYQIKSSLRKKEKKFQEALTLLDQAMALAEKSRAQEELLSLSLDYSKLYLDWGNTEKTKEFLRKASNSGLSGYALFQPEFYLISGKAEWMSGNLSLAKKNFETALQLAEKLQNPELMWRIHHQLGKIFLSSHNIERAYHELENAGRILKRLSENIKDEELKQNYLRHEEKKELFSDIKAVAKDLIGETQIV